VLILEGEISRHMSKSKRARKSKSKSLPEKVKTTGDALDRQRDILQGIMENAGVMLAYLDKEFNFVAVNSAYAKGSGHTVEELIGKNHFNLFPDKENQALFERVRDTLEPATFIDKPFEFADQPERGVTYWDWTLAPVKDEKGRVHGLILSLFETTQRKRAEEEVRALSRFPSENPNPVVRVSKDGAVQYCNGAASSILNEWKSQIGQLVPESWRQLVTEVFKSGTKNEFEEQFGTRTFSFVVVPVVEAGYLNIYGRDITERKKAEDETLRAKNEWERTFDSIPDLVAILDTKHQIVRTNKAMAQRLGMNPDECVGLNCFKCVHKLDGPPSFCPHSLSIADGKEHIAELHEENLGGDFLVSTTPLFDQQGQMVGSVHVARDITERKKAEQALRESQIDLNRAQAVAKIGSWRLDVRRNELLWSDETHRMFGIPKGTPLTYETFLNTVHPLDREYVDQKWQAAMHGEPYDIEHRIIVDGKIKWVREKAELEFGKDGSLLGGFGTVQDITEVKEMQAKLEEYSQHLEKLVEEKTQKLKEVERLVTIGETAGMVGHDIRNPLQSIEGAVYLAKEELESLPADSSERKELKQILEIIRHQTNYIDNIVADLQDFSRTPYPQLKEANIHELLREALSTTEIPPNIQVQRKMEDDIQSIIADPVFIKRIFTNLIENAVHAMPHGGNLTIEVFKQNECIYIHVEDTGIGISEENKPRIFTPLFTTKAKGQGFGLAVCKKLVEAHNGQISFESEAGKGTTFKIRLPQRREADW